MISRNGFEGTAFILAEDVANGKRTHHKEWRKCSRKQYER